MSSENRYGGLLTKVVTGLMRLSRVSASDKKQNKTKKSFLSAEGSALLFRKKHAKLSLTLHDIDVMNL